MARVEPEEEPEPAERSEFDALQQHGIELFNAGHYLEAHETFERIWVSSHDRETDFFKGLIQSAICLHHFQRGNPEGAKKLYSGHRKLLASFLPEHRGLDVQGFLEAMQAVLHPVLRYRDGIPPELNEGSLPQLNRIS